MSSDKTSVITVCGHGHAPEGISVKLFDSGDGSAQAYCNYINSAEPQGGAWITARIVTEEFSDMLYELGIPPFAPLILSLDDISIQKVMREVDTTELSKALKGADLSVQERFFRNLSKRSARMVKVDMVFMGEIRKAEIMKAQQMIVAIICKLEEIGEIIIHRTDAPANQALRTPDLCLKTVKQSGWALMSVPEALRTPEVCLESVKECGLALEYVPEALRTPEVCLAAVKEYGLALEYVPEALRTPEMYLAAVKECLTEVKKFGLALKYVPEALRTPEVCLAAVKECGYAFQYVPEALRTPEVCLAAVKQEGTALSSVPEALRTPEVCLAAVQQDGMALEYVPEALQEQVKKAVTET